MYKNSCFSKTLSTLATCLLPSCCLFSTGCFNVGCGSECSQCAHCAVVSADTLRQTLHRRNSVFFPPPNIVHCAQLGTHYSISGSQLDINILFSDFHFGLSFLLMQYPVKWLGLICEEDMTVQKVFIMGHV